MRTVAIAPRSGWGLWTRRDRGLTCLALDCMSEGLGRYIELTPGIRGGRPRVAGTRITVADIALMHLRMGQSLEEIAGKYDLPLPAVYVAMAYYYDQREEIERTIREDLAFVEGFQRSNYSALREKLSNLRGD